MTVGADRARRVLRIYKAISQSRDEYVLNALKAGVPKSDIHRDSGISRPTIDSIVMKGPSCQNPILQEQAEQQQP